MDGLECSVLTLRQIRNSGLRFDSDYYSKRNLSLSKTLSNVGNSTIAEYGGILDCSAFYPSITGYYSSNRDNIPFLRVNEINNGLIVITDNTVFLPSHVIEENSNTIALAYPGDIIIAKGGNTLAKVGLVTEEFPMYATCRDVIILRTSELKGLNKYYLWAFLHSKYGQGMLWRSASQTGQPHLTLPSIMKIKVPDTSLLQSVMEHLYKESVDLKERAETCYHDAERNLQSSLNVQVYNQSIPVIAEKSITESFVRTGRLDAEYYQPKYESIANELSTSETVTSICNIYDETFIPVAETEYRYIELANVGHYGDVSDVESIAGGALPSRARRRVSAGQVIISSVEGSLQSCALIEDEFNGALCSTGFYVLDSDVINSETLLVLFKSEPIQALLKQRCSGTILTAIGKDELLSMPLPKIDPDVQKAIAEKVQESFVLRRKSKELLEYAKQAVEMAIEQGEETALDWLKEMVDA